MLKRSFFPAWRHVCLDHAPSLHVTQCQIPPLPSESYAFYAHLFKRSLYITGITQDYIGKGEAWSLWHQGRKFEIVLPNQWEWALGHLQKGWVSVSPHGNSFLSGHPPNWRWCYFHYWASKQRKWRHRIVYAKHCIFYKGENMNIAQSRNGRFIDWHSPFS